ncbi:flagellar hook-basal body complex protein FliE [Atopomonas sediminilitoris]|uniref:flagellar hook-basal body complex protein FliE n=1 Tax=Atopomonas sediminilitoris TaxID=2919919 RepID=UPI001F4E5AAC|nr:flagellar hook-basal body complex protein FliE [Atopomonas sediminilitoris]MCJ8167952.1 flagellar hook-basal body complex protein FliE [Atopomonas sediminilitoris]
MSQGVQFNRLMLEMRAMQMDAMAKPSAPADAAKLQEGGPSFSDMLSQAVNKVNDTQQAASQMATVFEMGDKSIDLTEVMVASQKASVSFQAMTQVRNKLVAAYEDIMKMPI